MKPRILYGCALVLAVSGAWTTNQALAEVISTANTSPLYEPQLGTAIVTDDATIPQKTLASGFSELQPLTFEGASGSYPTDYVSTSTDFSAPTLLEKPPLLPEHTSVVFGKIHGRPLPIIGFQTAAVPEPGTFVLMGTGIAVAVALRTRRKCSRGR